MAQDVQIRFIQTSDDQKYVNMLEVTSKTVVEFCRRGDFAYERFIGVKRGFHPWQACFNRIPMLLEILGSGFGGWVFYLDADAYVADLDFDVRAYLRDKDDYGLIIARSGVTPPKVWEVNDGVFAVNLGHPVGQAIVRRWHHDFTKISDAALHLADDWHKAPDDDQSLLQSQIRHSPVVQAHLFLDDHGTIINWGRARFIRQILRSDAPSFDSRMAALQAAVASVMAETGYTSGSARPQ